MEKHDNSKKLVIGKTKNETSNVASEEFVGLKPKMYSFLVDNSEHKKSKSVNKNVVAIASHNEHSDVMFNNKCIRHSMNKMHRIGTYEINKFSMSYIDDKIYIQNNRYDGLVLEYWS